MKKSKLIPILFVIIMMQSCSWITGVDATIKKHGYITDMNGVGIPNVKLTVLVADNFTSADEETDLIYSTDNTGYYDFEFAWENDFVYRLKPTHNEYIYVINSKYPHIAVAGLERDEELNLEMMNLSKNKVMGWVRANGHFLEQAKVILLKREIDNLDYPLTTDIHAISDSSGNYYIEFDNENNYEYFLKPEKNNYTIDTLYTNGLDYQKIDYFDESNLASENISMQEN